MIIIKTWKKTFLSILIFVISLHMVACGKITDDINLVIEPTNSVLVRESISPASQPTDKVLDKESNSQFIKCSLQDGSYHISGNDIITSLEGGVVFMNKPKDGTYPFKSFSSKYLGFGVDRYDNFSIYKIFAYKQKVIYYGSHREGRDNFQRSRQIIIQDINSTHKDVVRLGSHGTRRSCYIKKNRLYYDEYKYYENHKRKKYMIKYLDLDTLETFSICEYDVGDVGEFVLREDGDIAFLIRDKDGTSEIITYSDGNYTSVAKKKWLVLIDYDIRGLYYIKPSLDDEELNKLRYDTLINGSRDLVLKSEDGIEKILITRHNISSGKIKIFDDFFLYVENENTLFSNAIEKYSMEGELLKKIDLKQWPNLGRSVLFRAKVIYYQGEILNVFYRRDKEVLEIETVDIE